MRILQAKLVFTDKLNGEKNGSIIQETLENLNLIKGVKQTLFNALDLIGVIPPEQM